MKRRILAAALTLGMIDSAIAEELSDGTDFLLLCEGSDSSGRAFCVGYLGGVRDAMEVTSAMREADDKPKVFCSRTIKNEQLRLIYVKWAHEHPETLDQHYAVSAMSALMDAFRCP